MSCTCTTSPLVLDLDCPIHGGDAARVVVDAIDAGRLISAQPPGRCELCSSVAETRPYGPNGQEICFACGEKDPEETRRQFSLRFGKDAA